jgi:hypothetical protein
MAPQMRRVDRTIVELLGQELVLLARGIEVTFQPAAQRLGCTDLVEELIAATTADASGTLRRLAKVIGRCLDEGETT